MITTTHEPLTIEKRHALMGGELGATFVWSSGIRVWLPQGSTSEDIMQAVNGLLKAADRWDDRDCGGT